MVCYTERYFRGLGLSDIYLRVGSDNSIAYKFYLANGFEYLEGRDHFAHGMTEHLMHKKIDKE